MPMRFGPPRGPHRGPHRPHRHHHGGGCFFFFLPGFLFRAAGMIFSGIVFGFIAVVFVVIAINGGVIFILPAVAFFIVMTVLIILSIVNRKRGSNSNEQNSENVTHSGETTFVDNTNYRSYENRADAFERSRNIDPFGQSTKSAQPTHCPGCGAPLGPSDKFCTTCGRNIKA